MNITVDKHNFYEDRIETVIITATEREIEKNMIRNQDGHQHLFIMRVKAFKKT